jgi:hypothetical protein
MEQLTAEVQAQRAVDRARVGVQRAVHRMEEAARSHDNAKLRLLEAEAHLASLAAS